MKKNIKLFTTVLTLALIGAASLCFSSCKKIHDKFDQDITLAVTITDDANGGYASLTWDGGDDPYEVYRYYSTDSDKGSSWLERHGDRLAETYEEAYYDHHQSLYSWYTNQYVYYWVEDRYGNVSNIVRMHAGD